MVMVRKLYNGFVKQPSKIKLNIYLLNENHSFLEMVVVKEDYKTALDVLGLREALLTFDRTCCSQLQSSKCQKCGKQSKLKLSQAGV